MEVCKIISSINGGIHDALLAWKNFHRTGEKSFLPAQRVDYHLSGKHFNKNYSKGWLKAWNACEKAGKVVNAEDILIKRIS